MTDLVFRAMMFARNAHRGQVRKYSGNPYHDHLAEVAGITSTVLWNDTVALASAWLHDTVEDCDVTIQQINAEFGPDVAGTVLALSDLDTGNRATRKRLARERLALANSRVQTVKCADLISNTSSIVQHDKSFARVYLSEKAELLAVMTKADISLLQVAHAILIQSQALLDAA